MNVKCPKCRFKFDAPAGDGDMVACACPHCGTKFEVPSPAAPKPLPPEQPQPSPKPVQQTVQQPVMQPAAQQPVQQPPVPKQPQVIYVKSQSNSTAWWTAAIVVVLLAGAGAFYLINNHGRQGGSTAPEMSMAQSNDAVTSVDSDDDEPETIDDLRQMIIANPRSHDVIEKWADVLSDVRLTEDDIWGIDSGTLRYLRNAIFAKHNYRFKSDDLMEFYCQYDWYSPDKTNVIAELNSVETYNIEFFKNHK